MKKNLFLLLLLSLILSTSTFLVLESSQYYNSFFVHIWKGLFLAILLESFVLVLAITKVYRLPLRILQKTLMLSVFIIIVCTASLHHVSPIIESISKSKKENAVSYLIKEEMKNLKEDLKLFDKQKQKTNTAIAANRRYNTFRSLISLSNQKEDVSIALYLDIVILILIRLVLQTCNLFCANMFGSYYRTGLVGSIVPIKKKKEVEYCICGCGQMVGPGRIYIRGHNLIPGNRKK